MEKIKEWIKIVISPSEDDIKLAEAIKKLYKTHHVKIAGRGTIYVKKK